MHKIVEELETCRRADRILNPHDVLEYAQSHPESLIHSRLEWDDAKCGTEYRLIQIRRLIQIYIVDEIGERASVSLIPDRKPDGGYRDVNDVVRNEDLARMWLADALKTLVRVRDEYRRVKELVPVWDEIDLLEEKYLHKAATEIRVA